MTALLLAGGVTAHVWVVFYAAFIISDRNDPFSKIAPVGFYLTWAVAGFCVYFWARVGGLA